MYENGHDKITSCCFPLFHQQSKTNLPVTQEGPKTFSHRKAIWIAACSTFDCFKKNFSIFHLLLASRVKNFEVQ